MTMARDEKVVSVYIFTTNPKAMKTIFTLVLSLILSINLWACSFHPLPFCESVDSNRTLIFGKIVDTISHGTRVAVIHVYRGIETRDTIIVWNAIEDCMGPYEVGLTSYTGQDSVFLVLPLIDSSVNAWDVVGDYKMDLQHGNQTVLGVYNSEVQGFIKGPYMYPQMGVNSYDLTAFIAWLESGDDCNNLRYLSVNEVSPFSEVAVYPNPTVDNLTIKNLPTGTNVELLNLSGQVLNTFETGTTQISTEHLAAGTYLLKINYQGESGFRRIVKF